MKRNFSLILALVMLLSTLSYAAPTMVGTVETTSEAVDVPTSPAVGEEQAELSMESYTIPEGSKLVFDAHFNNSETNPKNALISKFGTYGSDFTDESGKLHTVLVGSTDGEIKLATDNTLSYTSVAEDDDEVSVSYSYGEKNGGGAWPIFRATASTGHFADGLYTLVAEVTVPQNNPATKFSYTYIINGNSQLTSGDTYKVEIVERGTKTYVVCNVCVYDTYVSCETPENGYVFQGTQNKGSVKQIGFLFDSRGEIGTSSSFLFDDFKMYYQPLSYNPKTHANVSFDANGMTVTDLPENQIVQRDTFDFSQYSLADVGTSRFAGWAASPDGNIISSLPASAETTLYAIWDDNYYTDESQLPEGSKLVFHANFNNAEKQSLANVDVAAVGYYGDDFNENGNVPDIVKRADGSTTDNKIVFVNRGVKSFSDSSVSKQDDEALAAVSSTNQSETWPNFYIQAQNGYFADGLYTIVAEMYAESDKELDYIDYQPLAYANGNYMKAKIRLLDANGISTGKKLVVHTIAVYDNTLVFDFDTSKIVTIPANTFNKMGFTFCVMAATAETTKTNISFDNFKLYYAPLETKPGTFTVSFDANGYDVDNVPERLINQKGTVDLSATKLGDIGTSRFVGWATSPGGKPATSFNITANTTLYAIYDNNYYAAENEAPGSSLVFDMNFNHFGDRLEVSTLNTVAIRKLNSITSDFASAESGITLITGASSQDDFVLSLNGSYIGTNTNGAPDRFSHLDDVVIISDSSRTTKDGVVVGGETWPKLAVQTNKGYFADGIYTFYADLTVEPNQYIEYANYNSYVRLGGTEKTPSAKTNLPLDGSSALAKATIIVSEGKVYHGDTLAVIHTGTANTTTKMGFNFNIKVTDEVLKLEGQKTTVRIFADNFRMYYKPINKPASYNENSIRVNDPSGLRFKASVHKLVRENADLAEYGYIVTRQTILTTLGVEKSDFTMENINLTKGTHYVQGVSYGTVGDKKVDRIFETKENETFFTAVVYNIPANMYKDVIVVRPYVKIGENVTYGEAMSASIYEVAERLKASDKYESFKDAVDKILAGEEL